MTRPARLNKLNEQKRLLEEEIAREGQRAADGFRLHVAERQLEGATFSRDLLRELYWKQPDVHVRELADAMGTRRIDEVIRAAGPGRFEEPCPRCGTTVVRVVASRTAAAARGQRWRGHDPRYCEPCNAARQAEWEERMREASERVGRQGSEEKALFEAAVAAGAKPSARYVEYPGVPGTWRDPDDTRGH